MNTATDAQLIQAIENSDDFVTVTDSNHLAQLLGMDTEVADTPAERAGTDADAKMAAEVTMVRAIIMARIAKRAKIGQGLFASVAQVWNWWEVDGIGPVPVERAIKGLIADGDVQEDRHYGALAFRTL